MQIAPQRGFPSGKKHQWNTKHIINKTVILIEFDGVINRSNEVRQYLNKKNNEYLKTRNIMVTTECNMYKHIYDNMCYNTYMYSDKKNYSSFHMTDKENMDFLSFLMRNTYMNNDVMLYSNANLEWITNFLNWDPTLFAVQDYIKEFKDKYYNYDKTNDIVDNDKINDIVDKFLSSYGYNNIFYINDDIHVLQKSPKHWKTILFSSNDHSDTIIDSCYDLKNATDLISKHIYNSYF